MKNNILVIVGLVLAGIAGLVIGFGIERRRSFDRFGPGFNRASIYQFKSQGKMGMRNSGLKRPLQGQITKIDNSNVTIQLSNGQTYTFTISDQTSVDKTTKGTKTDLKIGQNITVLGNSFINGAQTVLINP